MVLARVVAVALLVRVELVVAGRAVVLLVVELAPAGIVAVLLAVAELLVVAELLAGDGAAVPAASVPLLGDGGAPG